MEMAISGSFLHAVARFPTSPTEEQDNVVVLPQVGAIKLFLLNIHLTINKRAKIIFFFKNLLLKKLKKNV